MATATIPISVVKELERRYAASSIQTQRQIQQAGQQMIASFLHVPQAAQQRSVHLAVQSSSEPSNRTLYEEDFYAWSQATATLIRAGDWSSIDPEALAEEVESVGASDYRAMSGAIYQILVHLLKWRYQPTRQSKSWRVTLVEHRNRIPRRLRHARSLEYKMGQMIEEEYPGACRKYLNLPFSSDLHPPLASLFCLSMTSP